MKRLLLITAATLTALGCVELRDRNPYENPFYAKYLTTGSALDAQIAQTIEALRQNPDAASLHNQLGALLVEKGFPRDAEREFERAVNAEGRFYPAWYNLGLVRAARGDDLGARRAFYRTVDLKPGHAAALFQLGLIEERRENTQQAIELYAKAFAINPALLDVEVNPRILDTELTHLALLHLYPAKHTRESMQFQGAPAGHRDREPRAPSRVPRPEDIVPPAPPPTDPTQQPPNPPTST